MPNQGRELATAPAWRGRAVLVALGLATALGQAPFDMWFVAFAALIAFLAMALRRTTAKATFGAGFWYAAGYSALAMVWIVEPFLVDPLRHGWMAPFAMAAMAAGIGIFWGAGLWLGHRLCPTQTMWRPMAFATGLALAEAARSTLLTGFPWALVGHIWIDTSVYHLAQLIGPIGLTLATTGLAAIFAAAFWRSNIRWGVAGLAVATMAWLAGAWLQAPTQPVAPDQPILRLVQPNAPQHQKWDPEYQDLFFERQLDFTARPGTPDLVIWPEVAVTFRLDAADAPFDRIAKAANGVPVIFGGQRVANFQAFNSAVYMARDGQIDAVYDKKHLVPFGEYIPGGGLLSGLGLRGLAERIPLGFSAGIGPRTWELADFGRVMPMICYEAIFPNELRRAKTRPDWVLHLTNDAWFGAVSGPYQHLAQARARAIEFGLPVVRVANTGVSAVIDPGGRVLAKLDLGVADTLDMALPNAQPATLYWRFGDSFAWFALIVAIGLMFIRRFTIPH